MKSVFYLIIIALTYHNAITTSQAESPDQKLLIAQLNSDIQEALDATGIATMIITAPVKMELIEQLATHLQNYEPIYTKIHLYLNSQKKYRSYQRSDLMHELSQAQKEQEQLWSAFANSEAYGDAGLVSIKKWFRAFRGDS